MNTSSLAASNGARRRKTAAFTLIELLVVISIIAVLAGILLPVIGGVMENARKTEARSTEAQIITSIKSFYSDYGQYPNPGAVTKDKTWTNTTNQDLFNILRAIETGTPILNTRKQVYFEGKDVKTPATPKSGFATQTVSKTANGGTYAVNTGGLTDPWGNGFYVRYDTGYNDAVLNPYADATDGADDKGPADNTTIKMGIIAWSWGKDGQKGSKGTVSGTAPAYTTPNNDDVLSWQ